MGLGFLAFALSSPAQQASSIHGTAGKQHNRSSVIFINRDREPLVENSSVLALSRQPRVETIQTVSGQFT